MTAHIDSEANSAPCLYCRAGDKDCRACDGTGLRRLDKIEIAIADRIFNAAQKKAVGKGKVSREEFRTIVEESLDTVMSSRGYDGLVFYAP